MRWQFWVRTGRQRNHSRPRVARAALAAHNVTLEMGMPRAVDGHGLAAGTVLVSQTPARLGGLGSASVMASPTGLVAAARASNRSAEEVWEETLAKWLGEEGPVLAPQGDPARLRRRTVWYEIDSTLLALRAG